MILRPSCSWCKDSEAFEPNPRLQALVNCFKKICQLIHSSPIREHILKYDKQKKKGDCGFVVVSVFCIVFEDTL